MRLLIVEDEPFVAADLESLASDFGHVVVGVADSRNEAIEMATSCVPDAALVDIKLRDGLTGVEIGQALRKNLNLPFAFVSGNTELLPEDNCGALAVVRKPFSEADIANVLKLLAVSCAAKLPWTNEGSEGEAPRSPAPSASTLGPLE
jgi:CheY-like chemotaxis protein